MVSKATRSEVLSSAVKTVTEMWGLWHHVSSTVVVVRHSICCWEMPGFNLTFNTSYFDCGFLWFPQTF
jgi:hypothetical protein